MTLTNYDTGVRTISRDPVHLIRHPATGRAVDLRIVLAEMSVLQYRRHWRDDAIRDAIEQWRQAIVRDTGSTSAPIAFVERLTGHLDENFRQHLGRAWSMITGKEKRVRKRRAKRG